jgi:hypothetical protein
MIKIDFPQKLQPGAYFNCEKSLEWISMLAKCDDVIDCLDASDEVTCSQSNIGILLFVFMNSSKIHL